jgi:hypothetical protein
MKEANELTENNKRRIINKIWILVVLNALDSFFTYIGIRGGYAVELNPLVIPYVENPFFMIGIKVILVSLLFSAIVLLIKKGKPFGRIFSNTFINVALTAYVLVTLNHIWILWKLASILSSENIFIALK